LLKRAKTHK